MKNFLQKILKIAQKHASSSKGGGAEKVKSQKSKVKTSEGKRWHLTLRYSPMRK
jgi:hypothetical protein